MTRVLLLGIFGTGLAAQFIKPLGDALQGKVYLGGALLGLVGYILYDAVRELTAAVRVPARVLVNSRQLGSFVSEAFQARQVEISFLGYTGETLYNELHHRLEGLFEDRGPTKRVVIRMLVPDFGQPMTVPSRVGPDGEPLDDPDFRKRAEAKCQEYDDILAILARRLTATGGVAVESEYRYYPGIPRDKVCIFNRKQVLHGLYDVSARMSLHEGDAEYYDPKGYSTDLNVLSRVGTASGEDAIAMWNKHYDDLWKLAVPPPWRLAGGGSGGMGRPGAPGTSGTF